MNKANVQKAINIMERVKARGDRLDMAFWQERGEAGVAVNKSTEEELHTCGTAACLAGWVAVSPEWKADGNSMCPLGSPAIMYQDSYADEHEAIAVWLGIDPSEADDLCATGTPVNVYGYAGAGIDVDDVLAALYRLRDTGTAYIN